MCLLFLYYDPDAKSGEYQVVIANNRDEFYSRHTEPASFWGEEAGRKIIGGKDLHKGREGGTWLALNGNGRFACLLNILQPTSETVANKKGRGVLVNNYVYGDQSPLEYLKQVQKVKDDYNGFLLVTMNLQCGEKQLAFYTNMSSDQPQTLGAGVYVFGNSPPVRLWPKAAAGYQHFRDILDGHTRICHRNYLFNALETLLNDRKAYAIDDQMLAQGYGLRLECIEKLNCIFVEILSMDYGTRSHSYVFVDGDGKIEFVEQSMKEPIVIKEGVDWITVHEVFKMAPTKKMLWNF